MFILSWPWVLAALPLPLLVRRLLPPAVAPGGPALRLPHWRDRWTLASGRRSRWRWWLAWLAWLLLVVAAARPAWLGEPAAAPQSGRDLILAVDISGSMERPDFLLSGRSVSRLAAVKDVAARFIEGRRQDRIGLILFGSRAYLQVPLTFDRATVIELLDDAVVGLAGRETAIGDAIALAVKRLREQPRESRVLVLLTDGENNAGNLAPGEAAGLAAEIGVRVYVIAIDRPDAALGLPFGMPGLGSAGAIDAAELEPIATATGGRFFTASDTQALASIYAELDRLEPTQREEAGYRPMKALFYWPLGVALLLSAILVLPGHAVHDSKRPVLRARADGDHGVGARRAPVRSDLEGEGEGRAPQPSGFRSHGARRRADEDLERTARHVG